MYVVCFETDKLKDINKHEPVLLLSQIPAMLQMFIVFSAAQVHRNWKCIDVKVENLNFNMNLTGKILSSFNEI